MTKSLTALVFWLLVSIAPASAGLTTLQLQRAGFTQHIGATIPNNLLFRESDGKLTRLAAVLAGEPAFIVFVDYKCRTLCGVVADQIAQSLSRMPLNPSRDYHLIFVGLGEDRGPADAAKFKKDHLGGTRLAKSAIALVGVKGSSVALEKVVGLSAVYDPGHDQYAHPVGVVLVDAKKHIRRYLDPFSLASFDLRLALTDAGSTGAGFVDHALLLCYGWDAVTGLYTPIIRRILVMGCGAIVLVILLGVGASLVRERLLARARDNV